MASQYHKECDKKMKYGKKSPTSKVLRHIVFYSIILGVAFLIFTIGFAVGQLKVPKVAAIEPDIEQTSSVTDVSSVIDSSTVEVEWIEFVATAYCPCEKCCGEWANKRPLDENGAPIVYGATGKPLQQGVSVAADTSIYPMGTQLEIEGMGTYIVHDRGGAIKGNRLDIYFDNHEDAKAFGCQTVRVRVEK